MATTLAARVRACGAVIRGTDARDRGALAFNVTALAAFTGLTVAVAIRASWQWPFAVILGVTGLGHLFSLSAYGIAEGPADDANAERQSPFPISRRPAAETRLNTQTHQAPAQNIPS